MSGSPVFDQETHQFVGMLVKRFLDFGLALSADLVLAVAEQIIARNCQKNCLNCLNTTKSKTSNEYSNEYSASPRSLGILVELWLVVLRRIHDHQQRTIVFHILVSERN